MKTVFYWSPCLSKVGTVKSTLNSAISLSKYSKEKYKVSMINTCGEWDEYLELFKKNNISVINFRFKLFPYLPKDGFISSRISYLIIILFSFFPLIKILKKEKPEFIIMHLITSLPIILNNLLKFKTKFILRISGYPKLNFFRKILWKNSSKNLFCVTSPTMDLIRDLKKKEIFIECKIFYLQDAIINVKNYIKKNKKNNDEFDINKKRFSNYFLSVGRLTKQKNYSYLISEFANFLKYNKFEKLLIIGDGEEKQKLKELIKKKDLIKNVFLIGKTHNVYPYMKNARALILSSLWEEVGFVIVEAAFSNLFVISSNCPNGPKEFLENGKAGYLFESNKKNKLTEKLIYFIEEEKNLKTLIIKAKKNSANYTSFRHYLSLQKILSYENKI
jgi:glycosyltransferase involved in cell wall biosynthesis